VSVLARVRVRVCESEGVPCELNVSRIRQTACAVDATEPTHGLVDGSPSVVCSSSLKSILEAESKVVASHRHGPASITSLPEHNTRSQTVYALLS
jgi:hypothetical protein